MKKVTIAFDVDGTLIKTWGQYDKWFIIEPNERIVQLLMILSSFKNIKIIVWSWQWKEWARWVSGELWICGYIDWYFSKNHKWVDKDMKHIFEPDFIPDIAIDDIQACELWKINLIVKEK